VDSATGEPTRVCGQCGQSLPLSQFDRRFWNKPTRVNCAQCREHKHLREQAAWEAWRERERLRQEQQRQLDNERELERIREQNSPEYLSKQWKKQREELAARVQLAESATTVDCDNCGRVYPATPYERRHLARGFTTFTCADCRRQRQISWQAHLKDPNRYYDQWRNDWHVYQRLIGQGATYKEQDDHTAWQSFRTAVQVSLPDATLQDCYDILHAHLMIHQFGRSWLDIRHEYLSLDHPYVSIEDRKQLRRLQLARNTRQRIYDSQNGRCYYCSRQMLPLSSRFQDLYGLSQLDRMTNEERRTVERNIPELDHMIPISRGGTHALDNLVYACRDCNQYKEMRTPAEFTARPNDVVTRLGNSLIWIGSAVNCEKRSYTGFIDGLF